MLHVFKVRSKVDNFVVNCYSFLGGGTYAVLQWDGIQFNNVSPHFHTSHPNDDFSSLGVNYFLVGDLLVVLRLMYKRLHVASVLHHIDSKEQKSLPKIPPITIPITSHFIILKTWATRE